MTLTLNSDRHTLRLVLSAAMIVLAASCATAPQTGVIARDNRPLVTSPPPSGQPARGDASAVMLRPQARWVSASWSDLPHWGSDAVSEVWPALLRSCEKPSFDWARVCTDARAAAPMNDADTRAWLMQRLRPWRVESLDGVENGLMTGYFEPLIEASRNAKGKFKVPLYGVPADLGERTPYWTRKEIDTLPAARASLRGRALAYVADPLDALILQIQGSGRLNLQGPGGMGKWVRVAYAGHNDHPYKSVGRWLIDQGELKTDQASWPAIKAWAQKNPKRINEMLWSNPRTVFFKQEPLIDPTIGPVGAQAVPLTPGRSIAVDPLSIPYGALVWLDTTEPMSNQTLRRAVMAQDTGSAITGAVRADYFWGWGQTAEQQAGRMKQPLRLWVLWPKP